MTGGQKLFVVTGAESSGKSTLANTLAERLGVPLVPEVARAYLEAKATPGYAPEDLQAIALEQRQAERLTLTRSRQHGVPPMVVADTDQRVIDLWWQEKYPTLEAGFAEPAGTPERYYLLCYPDLPWRPDPLRENPHDRMRLFHLQRQALVTDRQSFRVIWGRGRIRTERAMHYVRQGTG